MEVLTFADAGAVARAAAVFVARAAREAVAARGRCVVAVSGGRTPWDMLRALAGQDVPWSDVHVFQVDERVAPRGDRDRNLTHLEECLAAVPLSPRHLHPMPVEARDLEVAAARYARELERLAGTPAVLDLVHLGLGADGHTASLVPGDPVVDVEDRDVATTLPYQGRRRMTLTRPILDRARSILWVVTGADKSPALARLIGADRTIPASRIARDRAVLLADEAASSGGA